MDLTSIIVVIVVFFGALISAWGLYAGYRYTREPEFKPWYDYWIEPRGTNSWDVLYRTTVRNNPMAILRSRSSRDCYAISQEEAELKVSQLIRMERDDWEKARRVRSRRRETKGYKVPPFRHIKED
jgi:hypothetical protein